MDKDKNTAQENKPIKITDISLFSNDPYHVFLYKKTEKLIAALYLVTNHFLESEPMRAKLRESGLGLLSYTATFALQHNDRPAHSNLILTHILTIKSLLTIAHITGLISVTNFRIMEREFDVLVHTIDTEENKEKVSKGYTLPLHFFDQKETYTGGSVFNKGQDKGHDVLNNIKRQMTDIAPHISPSPLKNTSPNITARKDSRKQSILGLLGKGGNLTIKDFAQILSDCSEKTIQRELLQLVAQGVLKKEGERRWSRYSLAS
jgi:hypothetical protein